MNSTLKLFEIFFPFVLSVRCSFLTKANVSKDDTKYIKRRILRYFFVKTKKLRTSGERIKISKEKRFRAFLDRVRVKKKGAW